VAAAVRLQAGMLLATRLCNEQERTVSLNARLLATRSYRRRNGGPTNGTYPEPPQAPGGEMY
jgi:hypothetical protein